MRQYNVWRLHYQSAFSRPDTTTNRGRLDARQPHRGLDRDMQTHVCPGTVSGEDHIPSGPFIQMPMSR
jgi:hypothetical protein